jgi:serine/threonine protein kinase
MGIVWQARDEVLGRDVAVKELTWPSSVSTGERLAACRRAVREARAAARLSHRNVVQVFDILEADGCPWIVMELLSPRSLRDLVDQEGPLCPERAAQLGLEVLSALRAAHALGIVHRDVKPANILMAADRAVLVDFGIAQAADTSADVTTASMLIGSPAYIAPERARGGLSGPPADLWGLGASLYAAVEGAGPFEREGGGLASLTAVIADEPEPATHAGPLLWPVISGLLRKDPGERLDAAEAERMLRAAAVPAPPATAVTGMRRRSKMAVAALAGSAVLVAAAATVTVLDGPSRSHDQTPAATAPSASTSPPAAGTRHPAAGTSHATPAATHLASRTSPAPAVSATSQDGKADSDSAVPPGLASQPPKPGKGNGNGNGKGNGNGNGNGKGKAANSAA